MVAGTIVTVSRCPSMPRSTTRYGAMGLAFASDIGIAMQTCAIAVLLHQRRMVSLASLDYRRDGPLPVGRACRRRGGRAAGLGQSPACSAVCTARTWHRQTQLVDLAILVAGTALWLAVAKWVLEKTGSALPRVAIKRLRLG